MLRFLNSLPPSPFVRSLLTRAGVHAAAVIRFASARTTRCRCLGRSPGYSFTRFRLYAFAASVAFSLYTFRVSRFSLSIAYTLCFIRSRALAFLAAPFIRSSSAQRLHASLAFGVCVLATLHLLAAMRRQLALHVWCAGRCTLLVCSVRAFTRSLSSLCAVQLRYTFRAFAGLQRSCTSRSLCSLLHSLSACLHSVRVSSAQLSHSELSLLRSRLCVACGACGEPAHCCRGVTGPVCSTGDCVSRVAHVASPRAVVAVSLGRCSSRAFASPSAALLPFQLWLKEHFARVQFPLA